MKKLQVWVGSVLTILCGFFSQCTQASDRAAHVAPHCQGKQHPVSLYVTNWSFSDTLAPAQIRIDDSLYFQAILPTKKIAEAQVQKRGLLCQGTHRLRVEFGRYTKDTVFTMKAPFLVIVSMTYNPKWQPQDNGLMIRLLSKPAQE